VSPFLIETIKDVGKDLRFLSQNSLFAARKLKNEIIDAIRSLHQMPESFPFLEAAVAAA
jgi:hypothetical protein